MIGIGNRIKAIRKKLKLTQNEFSKKLNITQSTLSDIEINKNNPSLDTIVEIVKNFEVNPYFLLLDDDEMFLTPKVLSLTKIKKYAITQKHVEEFLFHFQGSPILQYYILSYYKIKMQNDSNEILKEVEKFKKNEKCDRQLKPRP